MQCTRGFCGLRVWDLCPLYQVSNLTLVNSYEHTVDVVGHIKYSFKLTFLYVIWKKRKSLTGSSIRHWIYCTSKGLHALGRVIVNKINLQLNKNTILIQSWKMLLISHYFLWITSDSHNQLLIQSTEMTTHGVSFTLVWFTAQDWGLWCYTAVQRHINILIPL